MAPEVVLNEGEVHQSSFHGDTQDDSNELTVTIHTNDIYRLYRISSAGELQSEELINEYKKLYG